MAVITVGVRYLNKRKDIKTYTYGDILHPDRDIDQTDIKHILRQIRRENGLTLFAPAVLIGIRGGKHG